MPHHSTNTTLMLNVTTFRNKTNKGLSLEDWYEKNATLCIQMENWHGGIPRHNSRSSMNMNYNILLQWELFHCHKYFTLWLNVTHLWALFHPSFCCLVHCSKSALMPFSLLYRHFLCAILAPCFVVFSSPPYRRDTLPHKKKTLMHAPTMSPWAKGFVSAASVLRMSNAVTVNPQSPRLGYIFWQWLLLRIKEGHTGKTGSKITTQCTLGTVISPGALKDWAKHLKGTGKNVTEDRGTAVPEHIRGTSILLSTELHYVSGLQNM